MNKDKHHGKTRGQLIAELEALGGRVHELETLVEQLQGKDVPSTKDCASSSRQHYLMCELYDLIQSDSSIFDFFQKGSLDGVWYWDIENPEHEWMSPEFWRLFGYDPQEMEHLSSEWQEMIFPEDLDKALDNFKKHCADPKHPYDQIVRYKHKDGSTVWVRCRGIAIRDDSGKPIRMLGAHNDLTQQKRVEEELAKREIILNEAQALAHLGSWRLDHSTGEIWWSDEIYRIFGVDKQSFFPTLDSFMGMVHPEDRQEVLKAFQLSTDACAAYAVDHRIVRPDGEIRHVQERGETVCLDGGDTPTHALGTVLDVTERTRAEEALRASEERWKFAVEGSRDGLWDWDATTDIVYFSPRWKHMLGYADHEIGTSLDEWDSRLHPDDRDRVYADLTPHLEGLTPYYENTHRVRCKNGAYKWILDRGKVIERDAGGKPLRVIGTHTDVTEERQAQQELRVARDRLEMAQSLASIGSWEIDRATGSVHWSDEVFRIFGKDPRDGTPSVDDYTRFVYPADRDAFIAAMETAYRMGEPFSTEHRALLADGQVKHISAIGKVLYTDEGHSVGMMGTVQDITERKHAEETLKASEEKLRAMSEASYDALIVVDANDIVSFWSPAAESMFGWTKEEVIGQRLHPLITPEDYHPRVRKGLGKFAKTGQGPLIDSIQEMTGVRKNGEVFPVERSVTSFKLGDSYLAVGSLRDITERKRIEQELRNYADRLTLASKAGGIGVWEWNLQTNSLTWDDQMFQLYNVDLDDFIGIYEAWQSRLHPDDLEETEKALQRAIRSAGLWEFEFRVVWPNDEIRYIKAAALVKVDNNDDPELLIGVNWDVTDSKEQEERLRYMATTDDMTRLHNRRFFIEQVQREMERSQRYPSPFSLIMFDADRFKGVNDTYGHDVGDMVLKTIAKTARDVLRDVDILGRLGGEEFAVGLPETDLKGAMLVAERLRVAIEETFVELPGGDRVDFTVSLGLAVLDDTCSDVDDLLKHADLALYRAKESGRNRVELYTESLG